MSDASRKIFPGIVTLALFAVMAAVFISSDFSAGVGFPGSESITAAIGYLLFDLTGQTELGSEGFLTAFEIIAVVLVAAVVAAVMLARRDNEHGTLLATDGGNEGGDR
jgi:NADH-quinone oxidoreductase subunit J